MSTTSVMTSSSDGGPKQRIRQKNRDGTAPSEGESRSKKRHRQDSDGSDFEPDGPLKRVSRILASIYYDINYLCLIRNVNRRVQEPSNITFYNLQFEEAALLLDKAVGNEIEKVSPLYNDPTAQLFRLGVFVKRLGWRMLAICSLAEGFRRAARDEANTSIWNELLNQIHDNFQSLDIFARTRSLDWRGPLLKYSNYPIPALRRDLTSPLPNLSHEHPHHFVIDHDKTVHRPMFNGHAQVHIPKPLFEASKWGDALKTDPTLRRPQNGKCNLCLSAGVCPCTVDPLPGTLVELFERPGIGVAVRALANFRAGDLLGQFVGEICPEDYSGDPVYSLCQTDQFDGWRVDCTISPQRFGNWTRFLSHHCDANAEFFTRTVGKRNAMTVEAVRDIAAFEEITVHYGPDYWTGDRRTCLCGSDNCVSRKKRKVGE